MVLHANGPQPHRSILSGARVSEGAMTRARRRRLLAETTSFQDDPAGGLVDWRDWANLAPELVGEIGARVLSLDVAEYLRFRAVCKLWRDGTDDPRAGGPLDSRFRPRSWVVLDITRDAGSRRRLLNLATAVSIGVDLPLLNTHCHLCAADGLLVLFHRRTKVIRLLDPLRNAVTEFPPLWTSSIVTAAPPSRFDQHIPAVFRNPLGIYMQCVNGAGLDDSTSPPTLVLCLRSSVSNIIVAKPGDAHWTLVDAGDGFDIESHWHGRVMFHSLISSQEGRCYIASPEGSIYLVQLRPQPKLVEIVDQRQCATRDAIVNRYIESFLFRSGDGRRMLMVRYWRGLVHFGGREAFNQMEIFTVGSVTCCFEVVEVDLVGRRFVPVKSLGRHAVFIGLTHCILISADAFHSIVADAIYLGYYNQRLLKFSIYHLNSRKTEPRHEFSLDEGRMIVPHARPCNLDQYLVCYVDRCYACINHGTHC